MSLKFEFKGYNRVGNKLRKLASLNSQIVDPEMKAWAQDTRATLKGTKYPPKRPLQTYIRTGRLANSWKVTKTKPGVFNIENQASFKGRAYAKYVVGDDQAWMHKGRWWKARDIIAQETSKLVSRLTKAIRQIWG